MMKLQSRLPGAAEKHNVTPDGDIMSLCREEEPGQTSQRGHVSHALKEPQEESQTWGKQHFVGTQMGRALSVFTE